MHTVLDKNVNPKQHQNFPKMLLDPKISIYNKGKSNNYTTTKEQRQLDFKHHFYLYRGKREKDYLTENVTPVSKAAV